MGDIKRQINSITDLKRASTNVNFVYRGATLVWQRGAVTVTRWFAKSFYNTILSETNANEDIWITSAINTKFR